MKYAIHFEDAVFVYTYKRQPLVHLFSYSPPACIPLFFIPPCPCNLSTCPLEANPVDCVVICCLCIIVPVHEDEKEGFDYDFLRW